MSFPVFLDACVLYPATLADTLLRIAEQGAFRPHWSPDVMEELRRNLALIETVGQAGAKRRTAAMEGAFEDAMVTGYEPLIPSMTCDPKDAHVLAAAVVSECQVLVTFNLKDFPEKSVAPFGIEAVHPDEFLLDQLDLYPQETWSALATQIRSYTRPAMTLSSVAAALERSQVTRFAAELRRKGWPT